MVRKKKKSMSRCARVCQRESPQRSLITRRAVAQSPASSGSINSQLMESAVRLHVRPMPGLANRRWGGEESHSLVLSLLLSEQAQDKKKKNKVSMRDFTHKAVRTYNGQSTVICKVCEDWTAFPHRVASSGLNGTEVTLSGQALGITNEFFHK